MHDQSHSVTQARIFAADYAADMARNLLDTIKVIAKRTGFVTGIGLLVSMPHQIAYILGLVPVRFDSPRHGLESVTLILAAFGIPAMTDLLILNCIRVVAARGVHQQATKTALRLMWYPILISGAVNIAAPSPWQTRILFGVMVTMIPAAEVLRSRIRPDFRMIDAIETQTLAEAQPEPSGEPAEMVERRLRIADTRARVAALSESQRRKYKSLSPYKRRQYLAAIEARELTKAVDEVLGEAPVSPALAGQ